MLNYGVFIGEGTERDAAPEAGLLCAFCDFGNKRTRPSPVFSFSDSLLKRATFVTLCALRKLKVTNFA